MSPIALSHSLPLPRGWPRCVRSAVVLVISIARASLALTQSWASSSLNPQLSASYYGCTWTPGESEVRAWVPPGQPLAS